MDSKFWLLFAANICGLIFFYYKTYLGERAKTHATRKDIEDITQKIEGVKSEFLKETEQLKAGLSLTTQHKLNLKKYETDAIFDFNRVLLTWITELLKFSIIRYRLHNLNDAKVKIVEINKLRKDLSYREANLSVFITDEEFFRDLYALESAGFDYETELINEITNLNAALQPFKEEFESRNEFLTDNPEELTVFEIRLGIMQDSFNEKATQQLKPKYDECKRLLATYNKSTLKILKEIDKNLQ